MIRKRGTKKLRELGFENLEVHKFMAGFCVLDKRYIRQRGTTCRKTQDEVVKDIQNGELPIELENINKQNKISLGI